MFTVWKCGSLQFNTVKGNTDILHRLTSTRLVAAPVTKDLLQSCTNVRMRQTTQPLDVFR